MKKIIALLLTVAATLCFGICASAESDPPLLVDEYGLFSEAEFESVSEKLEAVSEKYKSDVLVYIDEGPTGSVAYYADSLINDYLDETGKDDAVLLYVGIESRDWFVTTCGTCINAFTDSRLDKIESDVVPHLSNGEYVAAFVTFADISSSTFMIVYVKIIGIAVVIGLVVALIVVLCLKKQLKSVSMQKTADSYVRRGSFNLQISKDLFLYNTVTKTPRQSSSGGSGGGSRRSGGRSHGGRGGRF